MVLKFMTTAELPPYGLAIADDPDDIIWVLQAAIKIVEAAKAGERPIDQ